MPRLKLDPLLPQAGESLGEQIDDLVIGKILLWTVIVAVTCTVAGMEWTHYLFHTPPAPYLMTVIFLGLSGIAFWKIRELQPQLRNLRLGLHGERLVGQTLEELRARGYRVFHDVKGAGDWNIDHVLIGPGGVFAIQTKMRTKKRNGARIVYDGKRILVDGMEMERDPLVQAKAGAREIKSILQDQTALNVRVTPTILFPEWFVKPPPQNAEVYVANLKWFMKSFDKEHAAMRLDASQIEQLANGLRRYVVR